MAFQCFRRTIIVVIIWYLDLQLPVQSVPITANSNPVHGDVYWMYWYLDMLAVLTDLSLFSDI